MAINNVIWRNQPMSANGVMALRRNGSLMAALARK